MDKEKNIPDNNDINDSTVNESTVAKKKKSEKEIASLILNIVIWIFVAFAIAVTVVIFSSFGNDEKLPGFGKIMWASVQTDSMVGVFNPGDLIFVKKMDINETYDLNVGDIITFKTSEDINKNGKFDDLNSHEIVRIENEGTLDVKYITRGRNANITEDDKDPVRPANIIAIYQDFRIPLLGAVVDFLKTQWGFGIFVVIPVLALFVYYLVSFILLITPKKKVLTAETEEEIKQRAIEEYLRRKAELEAEESTCAEAIADESKNDNNKSNDIKDKNETEAKSE